MRLIGTRGTKCQTVRRVNPIRDTELLAPRDVAIPMCVPPRLIKRAGNSEVRHVCQAVTALNATAIFERRLDSGSDRSEILS